MTKITMDPDSISSAATLLTDQAARLRLAVGWVPVPGFWPPSTMAVVGSFEMRLRLRCLERAEVEECSASRHIRAAALYDLVDRTAVSVR